MNRRSFLFLIATILILLLFWSVWRQAVQGPSLRETDSVSAVATQASVSKPQQESGTEAAKLPGASSGNPRGQLAGTRQESAEMANLWRTPLLFYGIVFDENTNPIPSVRVSYSANGLDETLTNEVRSTGSVTTDQRGIFRIDGVRGVGLTFELYHPDYYLYPGTHNHTGFDVRSSPPDGIVPDREENAAFFQMHSKGHPVPLVHRVDGMNVSLDGTPATLDLKGREDDEKIGRLVVKATGAPPPRHDQQPFDWDVTVAVTGGGLIECTNYFDFVAPGRGYNPSVQFTFPKRSPGWTDTVSKNYFIKLPAGYARMNIYIGAKRPLFFSIEYDYNPDGSSNLERAR